MKFAVSGREGGRVDGIVGKWKSRGVVVLSRRIKPDLYVRQKLGRAVP